MGAIINKIIYCLSLFRLLCKSTIHWWLINNRYLFVTILEDGKFKKKMLENSVPGESMLLGSPVTNLLIFTWQKKQGVSLSSFIRSLISSWGLHPHDLSTSQRPCPLMPLHWTLDFNIWISGGHRFFSLKQLQSDNAREEKKNGFVEGRCEILKRLIF